MVFSESSISKYEAFLTNTPVDNWKQTLPQLSIICQIVISIFLIATAVNIKVVFKCRSTQQKNTKIKKTISFKLLNILYSLGFIIVAIVHWNVLQIKSKNTYILQYSSGTAFTLMLLTFLVSNNDAMTFTFSKYKSWKENQVLKFEIIKNRRKVGPIGKDSPSVQACTFPPVNETFFVV